VARSISSRTTPISSGNSYGCHENYCIDRIEDLTRLEQVFIPHLISRQIFTGAGKVVTNAKAPRTR